LSVWLQQKCQQREALNGCKQAVLLHGAMLLHERARQVSVPATTVLALKGKAGVSACNYCAGLPQQNGRCNC
jgi:hypothetical protein